MQQNIIVIDDDVIEIKQENPKEVIMIPEKTEPKVETKFQDFNFQKVKKESKFKIEPTDVQVRIENDLHNRIRKQIEFYFSDSNLPHDRFLQKMIKEGGEDQCKNEYSLIFRCTN